MNPGRQMNLGVYAVGTGNHVSGWRVPGAATSSEDFSIFKTIADSCERGKLDFLFVGDSLAFVTDRHPGQMLRFEPLTLHAALALQTSRVGLVATASTTYSAPFNIARMFASLDKLSGGRAGWNVVTTGMPEAAGNYGSAGPMNHATRYEAATEFVEVVQGLWDSWEEGAITTNAETGEYFDKTKVHSLDHVGKFYSVSGPLNLTRTPQGQPVLVQAGASEDGQKFASRFAEMIFASQLDKEHAKEFYATMKAKVAGWGRNPEHCKILPGFMPIVGRNEEDARKKLSELMRLAVPAVALKMMSSRFGHDMSGFDLDGPVPNLPLSNEIQTHAKVAYEKARKENSHCGIFTIKSPWPVATSLHAGTQLRSPMLWRNGLLIALATASYWCLLTSPPPLMNSLIRSCLSCKGAASFVWNIRGILCASISACQCRLTDIPSAHSSSLWQRAIAALPPG